MKIAYCLNSIRFLGGIQRVTITKANSLSKIPGNDIYVIVTDNRNGINMGELNSKVHLIDLDINYYEDDWKSKFHVIKGILIKRIQHKKRLTKVLNEINPDIVISVGQSEKNMVPNIKGNWKTIREFHFVRDYRKRHAHNFIEKTLAWGGDFIDEHLILKKYDRIVVLTKEDLRTNWKRFHHVTSIPNPNTITCVKKSSLTNKTVCTFGRLNDQKNYGDLIKAFRIVVNRHSDWILNIYGDGEEKEKLKQIIKLLHLEGNVFLKGYSSSIENELTQSSIAAYTSKSEGFLLAIIEAMECGIPVVSYASPFGPKDIISEGRDGYLVEVGNKEKLADRICNLIEDDELRQKMGKAASEKARNYTTKIIITQWMALFQKLVKQDK